MIQTPLLAVADAASDPPSANVTTTFAGAETASQLAVYRQGTLSGSWTLAYSASHPASGATTVNAAAPAGPYWWKAVLTRDDGTQQTVSNLVLAGTTVAGSSYHGRILDETLAVISALALPGSAGVFKRIDREFKGKVPFPCVVLSIDDESETDEGSTTGSDDWGLPVKMIMVTREHQTDALKDRVLLWRERVREALHNRRLDVPGAWRVRFQPRYLVQYVQDSMMLHVSFAVIRVTRRNRRP